MRNKNKTLNRDNNKCNICQSSENLEVHHIHARRSGGLDNIGNLITLCRSCHRSVESGIIEKAVYKCVKNALGVKNKAHYKNTSNSICKYCEEEFEVTRKGKIFCSSYCRNANFDKTHPRTKINTI